MTDEMAILLRQLKRHGRQTRADLLKHRRKSKQYDRYVKGLDYLVSDRMVRKVLGEKWCKVRYEITFKGRSEYRELTRHA